MIRLVELLCKKPPTVFFGGAGVSTESGIPDFRSASGLYSKRKKGISPETMLSHTYFEEHPQEFFQYYRDHMVYKNAQPNAAHRTLAAWEREGWLLGVITQNVDGLHSQAGSRKVAELHGSIYRNYCLRCAKQYDLDFMLQSDLPMCACGGMVRPDVVLYEEPLPSAAWEQAAYWIKKARVMVVGGTSLQVYPASRLAEQFTGQLVIINRDPTPLDAKALVIREPIGLVLEQVDKLMREEG